LELERYNSDRELAKAKANGTVFFHVLYHITQPTMNRKQIATTSISIQASPAAVWETLTSPDKIRQYMHGTETHTTWILNSSITFTGNWNGMPYVDKGTILEINPLRVLSYSYWSPLSGKDDFEDNYAHITFHLSPFEKETILVITQDNLDSDEEVVNAENNWMKVGDQIKRVVENNV
jgi:uncharacterized protein YndB with AHSA1/START domain